MKKRNPADELFEKLLAESKAKDPSPRKPITAGELMKKLESDPEWVKKRDEQEASRAYRHEQYLKLEQPIIDELSEAGCEVHSVWDLVNGTPATYSLAIPVLVHHLGQVSHSDKVREACARALSKKEAHSYFDAIFDIFQTMPNTGVNTAKWATANALGVGMTTDRLDKAFEIFDDPKHDLDCKGALYEYIKRYKFANDRRQSIERMLGA